MSQNQKKSGCERALEALTVLLENPDMTEKELEKLHAAFPDCLEALEYQYQLWNELQTLPIPEPSIHVRTTFYQALTEYTQQETTQKVSLTTIFTDISQWVTTWSKGKKWATVVGVFILGIFFGKYLIPGPANSLRFMPEVDTTAEQPEIQPALYKSSSSTVDRLRSVQVSKNLTHPDEKILHALNQALLTDPNVNVRLSAIESLIHFANHPLVREYLIKAIPKQHEPLVQIALADAMLLLQESGSQKAWDELLKSDNVETEVKMYLEKSLKTLY